MIVIVDTNIVFSAMLNINSNINKLLKLSNIEFVSINFLKTELFNHKIKIQKITNFDDNTFLNIYSSIISNIRFIDEFLITDENYLFALELTKDIDINDTLFVALTIQLNGILLTGDKKLYNGLINKNFNRVINIEEFYKILKL